MWALALSVWLLVVPSRVQADDRCETLHDPHVLSLLDWERLSAPSRQLQDLAHERRLEAFDQLLGVSPPSGGDDAVLAEMLLRVAWLYLEEGRYLWVRELERGEQRCLECRADPACLAPLSLSGVAASKPLQTALRLSTRVLQEHPGYDRRDEAHYVLGRAQHALRQDAEATATLTALVKTWPDSAWRAPAFLVLGELFEMADQIERAQLSWTMASRGATPEATFARYRLAWSWSARGEPEMALAELRPVLDMVGLPSHVQDELTRSLIWFYADTRRTDAIITALARGEGRAPADGPLNARLSAPPTSPLVWSALVGAFDRLVARGELAEADRLALAVLISLRPLEAESEVDAAGAYVHFAVDFPREGVADQALFEAANLFERQHQPGAAAAIRSALITLWPDSTYAPEAARRLP